MAKKKTKKELESETKEVRGRFIIKTDLGYYVDRNNNFELKEIYTDDKTSAMIFGLNIIGIWFMEALRDPKEKELIQLK